MGVWRHVAAAIALAAAAAGHPLYRDEIPNGHNVPGVAAPGHVRAAGGGPRNSFGDDFESAGKRWTAALCGMDSDGDGLTNGEELGDPDCIWRKGEAPTFTAGISHPGEASTAGAPAVDSCQGWSKPADTDDVALTFPGFAVPFQDTVYGKLAFNVADTYRQQTGREPSADLFGVRFAPIVTTPGVVHHMLLYRCEGFPEGFVGNVSVGGRMPCTDLRYGWAVGGKPFCLPQDVGVRFARDRSDSWHVLEIHYDQSGRGSGGVVDRSGVRMTVTATEAANAPLRPAAFLWMGAKIPAISIPPGQQAFHLSAACRFGALPEGGVTAFAYGLHGHTLARALWTEVHARDGTYLHDAGCERHYSFDLQELRPLPEPFTLRGDHRVTAHCVYDSTGRAGTTRGGDSTEDEMCITFLLYYPEQAGVRKCLAPPDMEPSGPAAASEVHECCPLVGGEGRCAAAGANRSRVPWGIYAHLVCMVLAFAFLMPMGAVLAQGANRQRHPAVWLRWHRAWQTAAVAVAAFGAALGFAWSGSHLYYAHHWLGTALVVAVLAQAAIAFRRPHPPTGAGPGLKPARPSRARTAWSAVHRAAGYSLPLVALVNIWAGAALAASLYPPPWRGQRLRLQYNPLVVSTSGLLIALAAGLVARCRAARSGGRPRGSTRGEGLGQDRVLQPQAVQMAAGLNEAESTTDHGIGGGDRAHHSSQ